MDFVIVRLPDGRSFERQLETGGLTIGRSTQNDLVLEDPSVSRAHARISRFPEGHFVIDTGGKNGTFVNEVRIEKPTLLRPGDVVRVGSTTLTFNAAPSDSVAFVGGPEPVAANTTVIRLSELRTPSEISWPGTALTPSLPTRPGAAEATGPVRERIGGPDWSLIAEADRQLVFHQPLSQMLEAILDLVHKAVPFDRGVLSLLEDGRPVPCAIRVAKGEEGRRIEISQTIADRVIHQQESVLTDDAMADARFREGHSVVAQQIHSAMCAPLWNNQEVIGLIYIDSRRRTGLFGEDHLRLLTHLANVAAIKIENARLFEQRVEAERTEEDLRLAWEIQKHLLPSDSPPLRGYALHGDSDPCRVVGGDLFDYIMLADGRCGVALGDVAGKGYGAALLMCAFQAALTALCDLDLPPEEMIGRLNRLLSRQIPDNRYVTFFFGLLDMDRHVLTYINAGHCPPWIVGPGDRAERLLSTGRPLGLIDAGKYESRSVSLGPGDILVCYSDGITEAEDPSGEAFGERKVIDLVARMAGADPCEIVESLRQSVLGHIDGASRGDDLTLVVLKRLAT